jgi:hypothetical protein
MAEARTGSVWVNCQRKRKNLFRFSEIADQSYGKDSGQARHGRQCGRRRLDHHWMREAICLSYLPQLAAKNSGKGTLRLAAF